MKAFRGRVIATVFAVFFIIWFGLNMCQFSRNMVPKWHYTDKVHHILLWNDFFGDDSYKLRPLLGPDWDQEYGFSKLGCPEARCIITSNRSLFNTTASFSSIVIHQASFKLNDTPTATSRTSKQLYIYFTLEAPTWFTDLEKLDRISGYFNLSMSYRQDADIPIPYGKIIQTRKHPVGVELAQLMQKYGRNNILMSRKEKHNQSLVAQFTSRCESVSGREALVKSLSQHITVDVYGRCSKLECPRSNTTGCLQLMGAKYKFYLSLENSVCKDYVTEKFFNILPYNTIPVVLNGADMSSIAPKHSYINVQDFSSTANLAEYLKKVAYDDELFASYFWWREFYKVQSLPSTMTSSWCDLCSLLHSQDLPSHQSITLITDLWQYWVKGGKCRKPPFINL